MALLLKIKPTSFSAGDAIVPKMKSAKLDSRSVGSQVFVWLDDDHGKKSALHSVCRLAEIGELEVPQVRDPTRMKSAYRMRLEPTRREIAFPLSTDDLEPYRYDAGPEGLAKLGRLHRDRNDKIIELSTAEAEALEARFRP